MDSKLQPEPLHVGEWDCCYRPSLRFAGGEGGQRRSGRCIFASGTRPQGRTPRAGRSVAHTYYRLHRQR